MNKRYKRMRVADEFVELQKRVGMSGPKFTKIMAESNKDLPERFRIRKKRKNKFVIEL